MVALVGAGCTDDSSRKAIDQLPSSCQLASVEPLATTAASTSDAPVVASLSNFIAIDGDVTVPLLTLRADTTVTASGTSGVTRTATGTAPAFTDFSCDFDYPDGLLKLHAAMEQLRAAAGA